jgi:FkbH-like protein
MEKIKLVIWDLDETFWRGTLSEEGVSPLEENIQILKTLTGRGIVNSIVSKNDHDDAKDKLVELGVWDYFVFPKIEWSPKGVAVKSVVESCQLRASNVLFVDDNYSNLEEAKFYNEGLHVATPDLLSSILGHPAFEGKNDETMTRLEQYKLLESKSNAKLYFSSNQEFLQSSGIKIIIENKIIEHRDRVTELIERTNQLNYTKKRISAHEVDILLEDSTKKCGLIRVVDKFGDYGQVGFYCMSENDKLEHFVFSCRILNLGVAQYIYSYLGFPELKVIPEVAEKLDNSIPDWITLSTDSVNFGGNDEVKSRKKPKILFKGGCDLSQMTFYLRSKSYEIEEETNRVSGDGFPIHDEHSSTLLNALNLSKNRKRLILSDPSIFFTDKLFYETDFFSGEYDCLVYSLLMDYTQDIYYSSSLDVSLAYGGYYNDLSDANMHEKILSGYRSKGLEWVTGDMLDDFSNKFVNKGQLSSDKFINNLREIRGAVPIHIPLIFLNGAEVNFDHPLERDSSKRHREMNSALDRFVAETENVYLVDLRKIIVSEDQLDDSLRHYKRKVYYSISEVLLALLTEVLDVEVKGNFMKLKKLISNVPYADRIISRIRKR